MVANFEDDFIGELNNDPIVENPSIWNRHIYPIGRWEYFCNNLVISFGGALLALLIFWVFGGFSEKSSSILPFIMLIPIALLVVYLNIINVAKRIYDLGWGNTTQAAVWISIAMFALNFVPIINWIMPVVYLIILFMPGEN